MNKRGYAKLVTVAISVAVLAGLFTLFDTDEILEIAASVSPSGVALVVVLLLLNQLLSTVRMKLFLRTDDSLATWLRLNHVNVQSLVAGLLFFNFIGQGLSRSRSYQREGLEADAFMVTGIERIISMTSLFALAFFSALLSFGGISLSGDYVAEILAVVITLTIAVSGAAIGLVYFARFRPVQNIFTGQQLRLLAGCAAVSTGMHLLMASAYLVVVQQLVPEAGLFAISGVVFIVMLAASLPISFAGWGIRELSAGFAFAQIGQSAEAGISVSIVLGVLASLTLVAHWLISQGLVTRLRKPVSLSRVGRELDGLSVQMTALLSLGIGMIIVFVMRVPTASGEISVNLADPLAIVAGLSFAYFLLTVKDRPPVVHVPGLPWALALGAAAILLAGLHGFVRFGVTDWALYNRMVGLGVLAAYFLAGASLVHFHGRAGFNAVGVCFFSAVFSVLLFEYAVRGFDVQPFSSYFETLSFTGFMLNSNKHAFVLLTALAAAGLLGHARAPRLASVLCGALTFGILLSYSRAGLATALIVIVLLRCFKCVSLRYVTLGFALVFSADVLLMGVESGALPPWSTVSDAGGGEIAALDRVTHFDRRTESSLLEVQSDRLDSYLGGLEMWRAAPWFGAGLGAFIDEHIRTTGTPLVIHSSPLWALAETGLIGALILALIPASIVIHITRARRRDTAAVGMLLMLAIFACMSLLHDMFYQRIFWFALGLFAALPPAVAVPAHSGRIRFGLTGSMPGGALAAGQYRAKSPPTPLATTGSQSPAPGAAAVIHKHRLLRRFSPDNPRPQ